MKKTAFVLVGLASSTAAASAAPRLAAQESAASRSTESPAPTDNFDAWLDANYGHLTTAADGTRTESAPRDASEDVAANAERFLLIAMGAVDTIDRLASDTVRILAPREIKKVRERRPPTRYPLVDGRGDIMCANVATKGGSKRVCEDRSGVQVSLSSLELE